ncbi:MAG: hypothetical protein HS116_02135 [Planctomycetes bacterium]|nr:hypothetical protein [Planctomycetota bacterium]
MKTAAEVKAELIAKGYQGEPTPEVLKQHGWEPGDPLAGVVIEGPARTPEQLRDDLALLHEEMVSNAMPAQIINQVLRFAGLALKAF